MVRRWITLVAGLGFLMFFYTTAALAEGDNNPRAVHGVLDTSRYDFVQNGILELNGEWEFYWSQLLNPESFYGTKPESARYIEVPKTWKNESVNDLQMSNYGYATYRLTVRLNSEIHGQQMAVYMPSVATSYKLWIDGRLRAENGWVGTSREEMVPKNYRKVVYFEPAGKEVEVVIQVANYIQRKGGLWEPIRLGTADQIAYKREKNIVSQIFVIGSLSIMGIYHLGLYLFRRKDKTPLFFGIVCLAVALRTMVLGETLLVRLFPRLDWEPVVKVEYLTSAVTLPCFLLYCYYQYPQEIRKKWVNLSCIIVALYCVPVLFAEARIYTYMLPYFSLFVLIMLFYMTCGFIMATVRKRTGARLNLIALLIFLVTVVNDILFYNHVIHTDEMISFGLLLYLFVQSVHISTKFSRAFIQAERLSEELQELNGSLERKVRERTAELELSNEKLQLANNGMALMESSRRSLLSNISHELRTPLTSIQGYVQAILDGVIKDNVPKYLELIYQKAQLLDHIFRDLLELSKLEARKIEFQYELKPAKVLVQRLFDKYEWDVRNKGLQVELDEMDEPVTGYRSMVEVDSVRIEQVFANFMVNAKKFTPAGGSIRVHAGVVAAEEGGYRLVVNVTDTGPGIEEEEAGFVFDRFYRGKHTRKAQSGGVGLGLAISKEIMDYHKGHIGVESQPGIGSTFYFTLPVTMVPLNSCGGGKDEEI
jgi:signal transduction histidine kinase